MPSWLNRFELVILFLAILLLCLSVGRLLRHRRRQQGSRLYSPPIPRRPKQTAPPREPARPLRPAAGRPTPPSRQPAGEASHPPAGSPNVTLSPTPPEPSYRPAAGDRPIPAAPVWRSRPIFITSTFKDFHAERDHLRHVVFPELEDRLRARFHHLEPIDLRWGMETGGEKDEQAKELWILKVCLDEIQRSRPFLIGLLGDRYGWVPPADRIQAAAREKGLDLDPAGKSVTALEIEFGVLADLGQARRSRFYFREPLPYDAMPPELAPTYSDACHADPAVQALAASLATLKDRIRQILPDRVRPYPASWDAIKQQVAGRTGRRGSRCAPG